MEGGVSDDNREAERKTLPNDRHSLPALQRYFGGVVIENCNSWRFTGAFHDDEVICDADGSVIRSASDADLASYSAKKLAEWKR